MIKDSDILFRQILDKISNEGKPLTGPNGAINGIMAPATFYKIMESSDENMKDYARACESRALIMFDEIIAIADDSSNDIDIDEEGRARENREFVSRSRLKIDARKWALSKMNPKKYGDNIDITSKGEQIQTTVIKWGDSEIRI